MIGALISVGEAFSEPMIRRRCESQQERGDGRPGPDLLKSPSPFQGGLARILQSPTKAEGKKQMIKPQQFAEQQVEVDVDRRAALNALASRQTISDGGAEPVRRTTNASERRGWRVRLAQCEEMSKTPKENEIRRLLSRAWSRRRRKADFHVFATLCTWISIKSSKSRAAKA